MTKNLGSSHENFPGKTATSKTDIKPWYTRASASQANSRVSSLSNLVNEASFNYRDRMPEVFDYDFNKLIMSADGHSIGAGTPPVGDILPGGAIKPSSTVRGKQIAIIGAGAAGLCAAYELLKLGFEPIIYEFQVDSANQDFVRPMGRGYSWDYTAIDAATSPKAGFTNWYPENVSGPEPVANGGGFENISSFGKQIADIGAMRYPPSHIALNTYVDNIFLEDYFYGEVLTDSPWRPMRNPAAFSPFLKDDPYGQPNANDTLLFPTVIFANGVSNNASTARSFYRMEAGQKFGDINPAINNVITEFWNLIFSENTGILRPIVNEYIKYTNAMEAGEPAYAIDIRAKIIRLWSSLNQQFQQQSLYQVLYDNKWDSMPAYPSGWEANPVRPSLLEMFGTIGLGSGGFDVFWWTTFMETLRIKLHLDEDSQRTFVGGTSYMLSPFLTHNVQLYNGKVNNLWTATKGKVITDPVNSIVAMDGAKTGVRVTTKAADGSTQSMDFAACIMTAAPSAVRSSIEIDPNLISHAAAKGFRDIRLTNSGKIAVNFPNVANQKYSQAFWIDESSPRSNAQNDSIVTTITDENVRQLYTFDNYYWGSNTPANTGKSGTLLLSYTWDFNSDSFAPQNNEEQVRTAWEQMKIIYGNSENTRPLPSDIDSYLEWSLDHDQTQSIVWSTTDGYAGGYRMANVGQNNREDAARLWDNGSEQYALWRACQTSYNPDSQKLTGFFPAGEAIAWLGLSGWVEGSFQTALASVTGVVNYLNKMEDDGKVFPVNNMVNGKSFSLPMLPGNKKLLSNR